MLARKAFDEAVSSQDGALAGLRLGPLNTAFAGLLPSVATALPWVLARKADKLASTIV